MKNLTIKIEAGEEMDKLHIEIENAGFSKTQYVFCIYELLLQLYEIKKDDILISVDAFLDTLKERGII